MAHGIQYVQATHFFELPSSGARGVPELRNKKYLNPNLTCDTRIWGRSVFLIQTIDTTFQLIMFTSKIIDIQTKLPYISAISKLTLIVVNGRDNHDLC
jgi:hypothetical protein